MSLSGIVDNIAKVYYNDTRGNHNLINDIFKTKYVQDILNIGWVDAVYRKNLIEACIKNTGMIVADLLIENTTNEDAKQYVIDCCIAMLFKYNKYEAAMMTTFKYKHNMGKVFNYMQEANTSNDILIGIFSKFHEEINTDNSRMWLMNYIGRYNNIELLSHVEKYYDIDDTDILNILYGTIDKRNHTCINTILYIFENYEFDNDINNMFNILKELIYLEHDEAIYYILTKLIETNGEDYINDFLTGPNMDKFFLPIFTDYFIKTIKNNLIPNISQNILNILNC